MESSSGSSGSSEFRISPTVSKEKWAIHARAKLLKGYVLIVARERKTASFFKEGRGFEPCPYKVAKALIELGMIEEAGNHFLGIKYVLSTGAPVPPVLVVDDDDEPEIAPPREKETSSMEGMLDDLEEETSDDDGDSDDAETTEGGEEEEEADEDEADDQF
jgi:hypothetical protein